MNEFSIGDIRGLGAEDIIDFLQRSPPRKRRKLLARVIEDSKFRPQSVIEQYELFVWMLGSDLCEMHLRINAKIAAAHKAMELVDAARCQAILPLLEEVAQDFDLLSSNVSSRRDKTHLLVSVLATRFQVLLFLGLRAEFMVLARSTKEVFLSMDRRFLTRAFFISSVNVVRCLAFIGLVEFRARDEPALAETISVIKKVFVVAFSKGALRHLIKYEWLPRAHALIGRLFSRSSSSALDLRAADVYMQFDEVLRATAMMANLGTALDHLRRADGRETDHDRPDSFDVLVELECRRVERNILVSAIRPESTDKVMVMVENFLE